MRVSLQSTMVGVCGASMGHLWCISAPQGDIEELISQVRSPRSLPGSAVLSYERRRDGCRVEGLGEVVAQGLSSRRSRWPRSSAALVAEAAPK